MSEWLTSHLTRFWGTPADRRTAASAVASGILHAVGIAICGLWLLPLPDGRDDVAVETVWGNVQEADILDVERLPIVSEDEESVESSANATEIQHTLHVDWAKVVPSIDELAALDSLDVEVSDGASLTDAVSFGGSGLAWQEYATGGGGSGFFGQDVEGKRVVFVVDASQSMNRPHPGPMVTRFGRVKLELIRSVSGMTDEQQFYIVFFNDQALPMPSRSMLQATPDARESSLRWAAQVRAGGSTNPEHALALALSLRPDVIYFLTDGNFPAGIVKQVTRANRSRVIIHTIGFADNKGQDRLKQIADLNWGNYRFIPATDPGPQPP